MKYSYKEGNFNKGDILSIAVDRKVNIYLMDNMISPQKADKYYPIWN